MNIAIIPARGGSKRLPGKNIRLLKGKPLIAYSIEQAKQVRGIDEVWVVSDSQEILGFALNLGAKVMLEPTSLATDKSPTIPVLEWALTGWGEKVNLVLLLQADSPIRDVADIQKCLDLFERQKTESKEAYCGVCQCVHAQKIGHNPILGNYRGKLDSVVAVAQEQDGFYYESGVFWIAKRDLIMSGRLIGNYCAFYPIPLDRVTDIDTQADWDRMEKMMNEPKEPPGGWPSIRDLW